MYIVNFTQILVLVMVAFKFTSALRALPTDWTCKDGEERCDAQDKWCCEIDEHCCNDPLSFNGYCCPKSSMCCGGKCCPVGEKCCEMSECCKDCCTGSFFKCCGEKCKTVTRNVWFETRTATECPGQWHPGTIVED